MKSKVIAIASQKGGVGKTTTAINLSASISEMGKKVLLIDIDPQGNATSGVGVDKENLQFTIYDVLIGACSASEAIICGLMDNLDIIPANINLSGAEIDLVKIEKREYLLKKAVASIKDRYEYIIIDCPPTLNMLTVNAMTATDSVIIPVQCEYYALEGLTQLLNTIELVRGSLNPSLKIEGIVFTMFDMRTNLSNQVVENVKNNLNVKIYETLIPRNVRLAEAPSYGSPICVYDPSSAGAARYRSLAWEVVEDSKNGR